MADTWNTDITHFGTDQASIMDIPPQARRLAEYLGSIINAATLAKPGVIVNTALQCRRRPDRRPCEGHIILERYEVPPEIEWSCSDCGDKGFIRNWRGTGWDLSQASGAVGTDAQIHTVLITRAEYKALRSRGAAFDKDCDRILLEAETTPNGILMKGYPDDLNYFLDYVAAEANHETNAARRKLLESAYDRIEGEL